MLRIVISFLLHLSIIQSTLAQSALLFVPGFAEDNLQGEEGGVGPDGTTFILSGTAQTGTLNAPFTMTLVQAATQVAEIAAIRVGDGPNDVVGIGVECNLSGSEADCIQIATFGAGGATTVKGTIPVQRTAVPILKFNGGSLPSPVTTSMPSSTSGGGNGGGNGGPGSDDGASSLTTEGSVSPTSQSNSNAPSLTPKSFGRLSHPISRVSVFSFTSLSAILAFL